MTYMEVPQAMALVQDLYAGRVDAYGLPEFNHLYWVASHVSEEAEVCAWLHDAVEDGLITWAELIETHRLSPIDGGALTLLTRRPQLIYATYIGQICELPGPMGQRAREVKSKDLDHNRLRPAPLGKLGMREPGGRYDVAADRIARAQVEHDEPVTGFDRELLEFAAAKQAEQPEIIFKIAQPRSAGRG